MTTLREREDALVELIRRHDHFTGDAIRDIVRLHLLGACEEAVKNFRDVNVGVHPYPDPAPRPTAEDALKAVVMLCELIEAEPEQAMLGYGVRRVIATCNDTLAGHRDTPAAKAITGEPAKASSDAGCSICGRPEHEHWDGNSQVFIGTQAQHRYQVYKGGGK